MQPKITICSKESSTLFQKVKRISNLEKTRDQLLDRNYHCNELDYAQDLIDIHYYKNKPSLSRSLGIRSRTIQHQPKYHFPSLYETALELELNAVESNDLHQTYPQGDILVEHNKSYLIEICSTYIDLEKKSTLWFKGESRLLESKQLAEEKGHNFRFLLLKPDNYKDFEKSFSKDEVKRIKTFLKEIKNDGLFVRKLRLPPEEFFTPVDYFINLKHNEQNIKEKLRKTITKCVNIT